MAIPRFTLHVKLDFGRRYCKAAWHTNGKIRPNVVRMRASAKLGHRAPRKRSFAAE